jgi:hypothetical protein
MLLVKYDTIAAGKRKAPDGSTADDGLAKRARVTGGEGAAKPKKGAGCSTGATHSALHSQSLSQLLGCVRCAAQLLGELLSSSM